MASSTESPSEQSTGPQSEVLQRFLEAFKIDWTNISLIASFRDAYMHLNRPTGGYIRKIIAPTILFLIVVAIAVATLQPILFISIPIALLAVFGVIVAVIYPKIIHDRKAKEIRDRFHFFITHLTVLSLTNTDRVEVFRTLANQDDYGALAEEAALAVVALVDTWNQSLDDAALRRSKRAPGDLLPSFFERLGYNIGAGQHLDDFLTEEQDVIMQQFSTRYQADLERLEVLSDLYLNMMLSATFAFVMGTVVPFLTGNSPTILLGGTGAIIVAIQFGFTMLIHSRAPEDPLWIDSSPTSNDYARLIRILFVIGVVLSVLLSVVVGVLWYLEVPVFMDNIPLYFRVAIPTTPLIIPGWYITRIESQIESRDSQFPAFIRSLGGIEDIKQTATSNVLSSLKNKDFGDLTIQILNLYRRLNIRINSAQSWRKFGNETGSYLIDKFSDMYVTGRAMGGSPKRIGMIISTNFREVLKLREYRGQVSITILGKVYGMSFASSLAYVVGYEISVVLLRITEGIEISSQVSGGVLFNASYNLGQIQAIIVAIIVVQALLSAVLIRLSARRHLGGASMHFVILVWASMATAYVTQYGMRNFIAI